MEIYYFFTNHNNSDNNTLVENYYEINNQLCTEFIDKNITCHNKTFCKKMSIRCHQHQHSTRCNVRDKNGIISCNLNLVIPPLFYSLQPASHSMYS